MEILVFLVAFGSSIVGAICGIGGGVIIKPLLDVLAIADVAEISFLSGCTVLSMSCYSVIKALTARESLVKFNTGTPLAVGAAVGGGMVGRKINKKIDATTVEKLFLGLIFIIIGISCYNAWRFFR